MRQFIRVATLLVAVAGTAAATDVPSTKDRSPSDLGNSGGAASSGSSLSSTGGSITQDQTEGGLLDIRRGYDRDEVYRFSCSVNFDNGEVRSAQIDPVEPETMRDRPSSGQVAMNSCVKAAEDRIRGNGYQHVDIVSVKVDDRPGRSEAEDQIQHDGHGSHSQRLHDRLARIRGGVDEERASFGDCLLFPRHRRLVLQAVDLLTGSVQFILKSKQLYQMRFSVQRNVLADCREFVGLTFDHHSGMLDRF